ncbi:hypothetical protein HWV07_11540 [Natronomonas salina]|uniref:hypothetical protein n=1 Tax=Natronomonas salina TaxID=1710540 RepID=UPI0015B4DE6A|nr:hypothetical protein [Natronomonas salina]QLD89626.1 hypothetical protein HWV07_11540 [Natronomonas salina]
MNRPGPEDGDWERRVLDDFGSDSGFLAFADISNAELLFLGPVLGVAMLVLEVVVLTTDRFFVGVALSLAILGVAGLYVAICPDHRTPLGLLQSFISHHRRDSTMTFTTVTASEESDTPPDVRELTRVRAVEPEVDAIRRPDETLVGAVRIDPANLTLADSDRWNRAARGFGDVLNALDYPVQIHSSARRVDPARMTAAYDDRRTDPDVQSTPALQEIVDVYRNRRSQEFRERGTSIRQYHVLVPVPIQAVSLESHPWIQRLEGVPVVGPRLAPPLADWLLYDDRREAVVERQREILTDRRRHLVDQLTSVDGVDVHSVSAADLTTLVEEYWTGQRAEYPDDGPNLRTTPVVMPEHSDQHDRETYRPSTDGSPEDTR